MRLDCGLGYYDWNTDNANEIRKGIFFWLCYLSLLHAQRHIHALLMSRLWFDTKRNIDRKDCCVCRLAFCVCLCLLLFGWVRT